MNTPSHPNSEECVSKFNRLAREYPARSLLVAIGIGLGAGLLVRSLQHTSASRTARLLSDLRNRLEDIAEPIRRQTEQFVESGASAVKGGVAHLQDLHLDRGLRKFGQRIKSLFS